MSNMPIHDRRTGIIARVKEHLGGKTAAPAQGSRPMDAFDSHGAVSMSPKEKASQKSSDHNQIVGLSSHVNTLGKLGVSDHHVTSMNNAINAAASAHRVGDHDAASGHLASVTNMLADARKRSGGPFSASNHEAHDIAGKIDRTISNYNMSRHDMGDSTPRKTRQRDPFASTPKPAKQQLPPHLDPFA